MLASGQMKASPLGYQQHQGLKLSHVCHSWHIIASRTSRLWQVIQLWNTRMSRFCLDRCHGGPVQVIQWGNIVRETVTDGYKDLLDAHAHQLKQFTIRNCHVQGARAFLGKLKDVTFPMLECVELYIASEDENPRIQALQWHPSPNSYTFVHQIMLSGVQVPLESGLFSSLTKLVLKNQWLDDEPSPEDPSIQEFVGMLEGCRNLRCLHFQYPGPRLPRDAVQYPEPQRIVSLPSLSKLLIEDEALHVAQILAHIALPTSAKISVIYDNQDCTLIEDLFPKIIPRDRSHFPRFSSARKLIYYVDNCLKVEFKLEPTNLEFHLNMWGSNINGDDGSDDLSNSLNFEFKHGLFTNRLIPEMTTIQELDITLQETWGISLHAWRTILPQLTSLRSLSYSCYCPEPGTEIKDLFDSLMDEDIDGDLWCPDLECIELCDFNFQASHMVQSVRDADRSRMVINAQGRAVEDMSVPLVEYLEYRFSTGVELKKLKLLRTRNLKKDIVDLMRTYVDDLVWTTAPPFPSHPSGESFISRFLSSYVDPTMYDSYGQRDAENE